MLKRNVTFALCGAALLCSLSACVTQSNEKDAEYFDRWDWRVPHGVVNLYSEPPGALIEMYNDWGNWVSVGSTPNNPGIKLEATGRKYLVRLTKPGYYPEVHWVAIQPGNRNLSITYPLKRNVYDNPEKYYGVVNPDGP